MNFEDRWNESFKEIQEVNNKKFGEFGGVISSSFSEFKPMFELFYNQGQEDILNRMNNIETCCELLDFKKVVQQITQQMLK